MARRLNWLLDRVAELLRAEREETGTESTLSAIVSHHWLIERLRLMDLFAGNHLGGRDATLVLGETATYV